MGHKAISTPSPLNFNSKRNILAQSSRFFPPYQLLPHSINSTFLLHTPLLNILYICINHPTSPSRCACGMAPFAGPTPGQWRCLSLTPSVEVSILSPHHGVHRRGVGCSVFHSNNSSKRVGEWWRCGVRIVSGEKLAFPLLFYTCGYMIIGAYCLGTKLSVLSELVSIKTILSCFCGWTVSQVLVTVWFVQNDMSKASIKQFVCFNLVVVFPFVISCKYIEFLQQSTVCKCYSPLHVELILEFLSIVGLHAWGLQLLL